MLPCMPGHHPHVQVASTWRPACLAAASAAVRVPVSTTAPAAGVLAVALTGLRVGSALRLGRLLGLQGLQACQ